MKLHLPKTLFAVVLACFAVGASYGLSVYSCLDVEKIVSAIPTGGSTTKSWNGTDYTFTLLDGMLAVSGYEPTITTKNQKPRSSLSNITFEVMNSLVDFSANDPVSLIWIKYPSYTWGVNVKKGTGTGEGYSSLFTGKAKSTTDNNDWTGAKAPNKQTSGMKVTSTDSDGNKRSVVSACFNTDVDPGVTLANGYQSKTDKDNNDCIYYAGDLRWGAADDDASNNKPILQFNTTYVTSLIQQADHYESGADTDMFNRVTNADGTWHKDYTSMATAVSNTSVGATLVTENRLEVNSDNASNLSTNGGDIIIGGAGQLYLNSSADIELSNAIYLGGSTYSDAATQGALYFGGSGATTLSGAITVVENSTMGKGTDAGHVTITGKVSDTEDADYTLSIVQGTEIEFAGGMDLGTLELASGVSIDISSTETILGNFGTTGTGAQVTVTGTTLTINGLYAGYSEVLTTGVGGAIVFGQNATIDVSKLTATGKSDMKVDGFIQESYSVTASDVSASIEGETIALVRGDESLGNATWSRGEVTMGQAIYNVATTKSYADYLAAAKQADKTALFILVQNGGTLQITSAATLGTNVKALSGSTLDIGEKAEVNSTYITEGRENVTLTGSGTYVATDTSVSHDSETTTTNLSAYMGATLGDGWTGTVKFDGGDFWAANLGSITKGSIELSGVSGMFAKGASTCTVDLILTDKEGGTAAFSINNGWSDKGEQVTFTGAVSGNGTLERINANGANKTYKFTGNVSKWTGKFTGSYTQNHDSASTTLEFSGNATKILAGVEGNANSIVNVKINNDSDVTWGDSTDATGEKGKIAINQKAGSTLTTSGAGAKKFLAKVEAQQLVTSGGNASFKHGAKFGTIELSNRGEQTIGTVQNVTIDATQLTRAGTDVATLGKMVSLDVTFAAALSVSNVEMQNVTLKAAESTNGTVTYSNATAVAASTPAPLVATLSDTTQTLTATPVQQGGTAAGTLTVDVDASILSDSAGKTLSWTIFDGVSLAEGETFKLNLGKTLATIVGNGKPKVTLSGDWVVENEAGDRSVDLTSADLSTNNQITGNLLAAPVNSDGSLVAGDLVLTIENVPEPTTGTLSVLALAALAARRRRRE